MTEAHVTKLDQQLEPVEGPLAGPAGLGAEHWPAAELFDHSQQRLIGQLLDVTLTVMEWICVQLVSIRVRVTF